MELNKKDVHMHTYFTFIHSSASLGRNINGRCQWEQILNVKQCWVYWQRFWPRESYGLLGESIPHPWASAGNLIPIVSESHTRPCDWSFSTQLKFYDQLSFSDSKHTLFLPSVSLSHVFKPLSSSQLRERPKQLILCLHFSQCFKYIIHLGLISFISVLGLLKPFAYLGFLLFIQEDQC